MSGAPELNQTLQELIDHHEIRKTLAVYCHGCDRGDEVRMASVYSGDSWDDHGLYKGPSIPHAKHAMEHFFKTNSQCSHLLGQSLIKSSGMEAGAETYFLAVESTTNEDGREVARLMGGRYADTLRREDGQWKISKRVCIIDWAITHPVETDWLKKYAFCRGQQSGEDPSYALLGLVHPGFPMDS